MAEYLRRKIDSYLVDWKANPNHKPLIIKGARQVGKTKSIKVFAQNNYESIVEINFVSDPQYEQIIENGYSAEAIVKNISRINPSAKFIKGKTLIFFDEIQKFPDIATALKFFALDGNYDVICCGSLPGIHYKEISSISVGYKTEIEMRSLDFEEFLWAVGYNDSIKEDILSHMLSFTPFSPSVLQIYSDLFLDYCIVGGMPDVVKTLLRKRLLKTHLTFKDKSLSAMKLIYVNMPLDLTNHASQMFFVPFLSNLEKRIKNFKYQKCVQEQSLKITGDRLNGLKMQES